MRGSCEVAVIGAGPYGLSVAAHLSAAGIDHRIFGRPLDTWGAHMPKGMMLKSDGFASNLSAPSAESTLKAYNARHGIPYADQGLPVSLENFLNYAQWFQTRYVPQLEIADVTGLAQNADGSFELTLSTGEELSARQVVLAIGITHFAHTPEVFNALPQSARSHSYNHCDVKNLRGKEVVVIGSGASALDLAHLLDETGVPVRIVARTPEIEYNLVPDPDAETLFKRIQKPASGIGRGWKSYFCAYAPLMFHRLPRHLKTRAIRSHMHPAAGWFMREKVEGKIPMSLGRTVEKAVMKNDRIYLQLRDRSGGSETVACDYVITATGYRADMHRLGFVSQDIRARMAPPDGIMSVSDTFETPVTGLFALGLTAMNSFGPLMRFMVGAEFAAPRVVAHLARMAAPVQLRQAA